MSDKSGVLLLVFAFHFLLSNVVIVLGIRTAGYEYYNAALLLALAWAVRAVDSTEPVLIVRRILWE